MTEYRNPMAEFKMTRILEEIDEETDLVVEVNPHKYGIEADLFFESAPRKGLQLYTEEDGEETLVEIVCRGETMLHGKENLDWQIGERLKQKIGESMGADVNPPAVEVEFTCDLEDAYRRLKGAGEMQDHEYIVMGAGRSDEQVAEAAIAVATETVSTVLLAHRGYGITVFPGQPVEAVTSLMEPR